MKKELQFGQSDLANSLAMNLKSEEDVSGMARMLSKVAIERALEIGQCINSFANSKKVQKSPQSDYCLFTKKLVRRRTI